MWPFSASPYDGLLKTIDQVATPLANSHPSSPENAKEIREYDYIIVGGGTAGCVLARRLTENPDISVLVLERGDASTPWISSIPLILISQLYDNTSVLPFAHKWTGTWKEGSTYDRPVDTGRLPSNPPKLTRTRQLPMLAGNALGGTTKINQQLYTRPFAGELNYWAKSCQDPSWSYENMAELMRKSECNVAASTSEKKYRGQDGPWLTQKYDKIYFNSCNYVAKACEAIGIPVVSESNRPDGPAMKLTEVERTMTADGMRLTTFDAFLPPGVLRERKSKLTLCVGAVVSSIDIRGNTGDLSAKGVFLEPALGKNLNGKKYYVSAKREVILCGGAIVSPQLLLLSGVGPKKHLEQMGISVIKDLPGVGSHLQDHTPLSVMYSVPIDDSFLVIQKRPLTFLKEALKYFIYKTGLFIFPIPQYLLFARSALLTDYTGKDIQIWKNPDASQLDTRSSINVPDIEIECIPGPTSISPFPTPANRGAYSFLCLALQPRSLGSVTLSSRNPHERPKCTLGLFSHPYDLNIMRKAAKLALKIGRTMKEQGYDIEPLWIPRSESDEDLDEFILFEPKCNYHFSSTCRMAPEFSASVLNPTLNGDDVNGTVLAQTLVGNKHTNKHNKTLAEAGLDNTPGVVDSQLRVYGIKGLRIADASVFPTVPACHLQAPVVLVAEKCAELIKATWP